MFINDLQGILINLKEDDQTRYQCEIWFDYTRKYMEQIREGAFLAAPNFSSNNNGYRYTILEVVSILPIHYGLGENVKGYPGFVKEAAKSAFSDWKQQEDEVREDTTQIRIIAIPTNYEVNEEGKINNESNLPMSGCDVRFINNDLTRKIANLGIDPEKDNIIKAGHLIREQEIETYVLVEELLQVHFGIFGFTGAGKSNLLSTLVAKLFQERTINQDPLKVVFFDLMSEYVTLALDLLIEKDTYLIGLGEQTFPGEVIEYLSGKQDKLDAASEAMTKTTLLPKALKKYRESLTSVYRQLLEERKILVYQKVDISKTLGEIVKELWEQNKDKKHGSTSSNDQENVEELINKLKQNNKSLSQNNKDEIFAMINDTKDKLKQYGKNWLKPISDALNQAWENLENNPPLPSNSRITVPWLVEQLNNPNNDNLFIIQSHNPDELRSFSSLLGNITYEERRRKGQISPLVSFVFDEADEFIPQNPQGSYKASTEIAMTLARRGRKFGLGIGIATQRITYLDTSILAQPHTYFVSKLPRKSDQDRIREAFGISEEMFRQTVKFKKGDWLLVSYDATGLEAVPLPIHTPDANERLGAFLENYKG